MTLRFSTFYASIPSEDDALAVHPHAKTTHEESIAMLNMLFRSAKFFNPEAKFSILTSKETDLSSVDMAFDRIDIEVDRFSLMLDRTFGQWLQVRALPEDETLVLLDTDIIVQAGLSELEEAPFDIGLSWRRATVPINGGVLVVRNRGNRRAVAFFDRFLQNLEERPTGEWQWNGDQLALCDLVPAVRPWTGRMLPSSCEDAAVHLLHCDVYNYSPPDEAKAFTVPALRDRCMIHFKGHRKRFMTSYFNDLLSTHDRGHPEDAHRAPSRGSEAPSPARENMRDGQPD